MLPSQLQSNSLIDHILRFVSANCREDLDFTYLSFVQQLQTMSPPRLASSARRNIVRIKIKKAEKKTELMEPGIVRKPHESTCCSSQVARVAPAESPTRNLEADGRPVHSLPKRRISDLASDHQYQKRRKLIDDSLREKGTDSVGNMTVKETTISGISWTSGSHQILTSTGSSCVLERQEKGKIGDSTDIPKANESEESFLLLNEARDFKHRADRLKREGKKPQSMILYMEAVLKFLKVASLWEHGLGKNNEASMHLYFDTAKFCQYCASECEQEKNKPAAALAYKALELASMRHAFLISPALATNEAISLGDAMTAAFEATMRYQMLMHGKDLAAPLRECLNFHFNNVNVFIEMAHRAFESIF